MNGRVSQRTSSVVYAIVIIYLLSLLISWAGFFRGTPIAIMLGGFIGSLLFFFLVVFIGHIYELRRREEEPGWVPISVSLSFSIIICLLIDKFCCLFCLAFSVPMVTYLSKASHMTRPRSAKTGRRLDKND